MKNLLFLFLFSIPFLGFSQGSMDFENVTLTTGYADSNCVDNGITYTYTQARDQDTFYITNLGFMLRKASESTLEWTIPNGIGDLSFQFRKAYSGGSERQLEIYVNGTAVDSTIAFGSGSGFQSDIYTYNGTINTSGAVTIKIKNVGATTGNRQSIIDNIAWTAYQDEPACPAPSNLQYTVNPNGTVTVTWDAPATAPQYGYGVAVLPLGTPLTTSNVQSVSGNSYTTADSLINGDYTISLASICDIDVTTMTATTSDTLTQNITVPLGNDNSCEDVTNLSVTNPGGTDVMLTWTAPATTPADGYGIVVFDSNNNALDTLYTQNTSFVYSNDLSGGLYTFVVYSLCDLDNGEVSNGTEGSIAIDSTANTCADVIDLQVTDNGDGTFTATWVEPAGTNDGYYIMITAYNSDYAIDSTITGNSFTSPVLADDDYDFFISTICDDANDIVSDGVVNTFHITTEPPVESCDAPTNVEVINNEDGTITVTWTAPDTAPADGYGVLIVPQNETPNFDNAEIVTSTTYLSDSLANGNYDVYVFSVCDLATDLTSEEIDESVVVTNTLGVKDLNLLTAIYPNPVKTILNIETGINNGTITITNLMGQTIETVAVSNAHTAINVANLSAGIYQVIYTSNVGRMTSRFVKE